MVSKFRNVFNLRYFSHNSPRIPNTQCLPNSSQLQNLGEDVASYVRFNRNIVRPQASDYGELLEPFCVDDRQMAITKARIHLICCEFDYFCRLNMRVPNKLTVEAMKKLLMMDSQKRQVFLIQSYSYEALKAKDMVKKAIKSEARQGKFVEFKQGCFDSDGAIQYGLWKNSLFFRVDSSPSMLIFSAIRTKLYSPKLIIDWRFPVKIMEEQTFMKPKNKTSDQSIFHMVEDGLIVNPFIKERSRKNLVQQMFDICNYNLRCHKRAFNIVHYGLNDSNPFKDALVEKFSQSSLDNRFFEIIDQLPDDCEVQYLTPFATKRFVEPFRTSEDLIEGSETSGTTFRTSELQKSKAKHFMISPYSELYQFGREVQWQLHVQNNAHMPANVNFYRHPIEDYTKPGVHIVLRHYINSLRDAHFGQCSWIDSMRRHISKRDFLVDSFNVQN